MSEIKLEFTNKTAAKIDSFGAELKSLVLNGQEIMWQAGEAWAKTAPWLFPMVGALKDGVTLINGEKYAVPRHGFARDNEFSSSKMAENCVTFTLKQNEKTLQVYPFKFTLQIKYKLLADRLRMTAAVTNNDEKAMPYCIGGHPAFNVPFDADEGGKFSDYSVFFENAETIASPVFGEDGLFIGNKRIPRLDNSNDFKLTHETFDGDCVYFDTITSKQVLLSKDGKTGVKIEWKGYKGVGIWSPPQKKAPFVCIEPWCGSADFSDSNGVFADKKGIEILEPSETRKYVIQIINCK
jgi:galactose mutarotase-like enzyme